MKDPVGNHMETLEDNREAHQLAQFVLAQVIEYEAAVAHCPPGQDPYRWRTEARGRLYSSLLRGSSAILDAPSQLMRHMEQILIDIESTRLRPIFIEREKA